MHTVHMNTGTGQKKMHFYNPPHSKRSKAQAKTDIDVVDLFSATEKYMYFSSLPVSLVGCPYNAMVLSFRKDGAIWE